MNCDEARAAMQRQFAGELEPALSAPLRAHLAGCPSCREYYERLARADQVLERGGLSEPRTDALEARLLARVAPVAAAPARPPMEWPRLAAWVALVAAALAVMVVPAWRADDFAPRGGGGEAWGVRAFCVASGPRVVGEARGGGTLRCAPGSMVQFTYTAPRAARLSIALEASGQRFFPGDGELGDVGAGVDVALPRSTPVGAWLTGPQRVSVRFTDAAGQTLAESALLLSP